MNKVDIAPELWPIVSDRNDKVIGYGTEDDCHGTPKLRHRTVGVLVTNEEGHILLQRRDPRKKLYPDYLGMSASGHVQYLLDQGRAERYRTAAEREFREELQAEPGPLLFVARIRIDDLGHPTWTTIYRSAAKGPFTPREGEVAELVYVRPENLLRMQDKITPPSWRMLIAARAIPQL